MLTVFDIGETTSSFKFLAVAYLSSRWKIILDCDEQKLINEIMLKYNDAVIESR